MSNYDLSRVLRVAIGTQDVDDILEYLVHVVNQRITVRGEEFGTTDEQILTFFNEMLQKKMDPNIIKPILETCSNILGMEEDIGLRASIVGILQFRCLNEVYLTPQEAENIDRFLSVNLEEMNLSEHDSYKLCRALIELGYNVPLKLIEKILLYYIETSIPKNRNTDQVLKHSKSLVSSIKREGKFIDKELFWDKLMQGVIYKLDK